MFTRLKLFFKTRVAGYFTREGKWVVHYDIPHTAKTWHQRTGRIHRLGQTSDVDVITLNTDTILDQKKRARLERKNGLRELLTSPYESMDESGLGAMLASIQAQPDQPAPAQPGPMGMAA